MSEVDHIAVIDSIKSNKIANYIAPGLDSYLIGRDLGSVRMFEMTRPQEFFISPHSHRFDFACLVLLGEVLNTLYVPNQRGYEHEVSTYTVDGYKEHGLVDRHLKRFVQVPTRYTMGQWYGMGSNEFHTIAFGHGAKVLFFEGPNCREESEALQPVVNGKVISTFSVEDWMYHE